MTFTDRRWIEVEAVGGRVLKPGPGHGTEAPFGATPHRPTQPRIVSFKTRCFPIRFVTDSFFFAPPE